MNDWVGGTDPKAVGDASAALVRGLLPINPGSKILDFGCGIGRTMAALLDATNAPTDMVGMDIMPQVIQFCESHIKTVFPSTRFELIDDSNIHYDQFIGGEARTSKETLKSKYDSYFTDGYAFSVFTHIDRKDFEDVLKFVSAMMSPGGRFLMTCFALTEHSRMMIDQRQAIFPFQESVFVDDGAVFWGNQHDPLGFIAFDRQLIEQMVWSAGLVITKVQYGCWMGGDIGASLQDVFVVTKPFALQREEDIEMTPVVDRSTLS